MTEKATFGAGCFWGVEAAFRQMAGVISTAVGYEGGEFINPTYHDVCTDQTGHAEVVEVEYDPSQASYDVLLNVFWENHNPTTLNRQGPDIGRQYRSAIFYHTPEQRAAAEASKTRLEKSGEVQQAHRHRGCPRYDFLSRRRVPPAVFGETWHEPLSYLGKFPSHLFARSSLQGSLRSGRIRKNLLPKRLPLSPSILSGRQEERLQSTGRRVPVSSRAKNR